MSPHFLGQRPQTKQYCTRETRQRAGKCKTVDTAAMGKPRLSRENVKEEKRRMRINRKKRKRQLRNASREKTDFEKNLELSQLRQEKEDTKKAKLTYDYMARRYYDRWQTLTRTQKSSNFNTGSILATKVICQDKQVTL